MSDPDEPAGPALPLPVPEPAQADGPGALSPRELFRLIAQEAYRDGHLGKAEREILVTMARFLRLPEDVVTAILQAARANFQAGALGEPRPLLPHDLYAHALGYVLADGKVDPIEEKMLQGLRRVLRLDQPPGGPSAQ